MKKKFHQQYVNGAVFCARMVVLFSLIVSQFFGVAPQHVFATDDVDVGIVLPAENGRWLQDKARFEDALTTAGFTSEVLFSQDDSVIEKTNVESLLAKNIKVLIICPNDGAAAADAVEEARLAGVKVIAYDRLIMNTEAVDFYVTFDSISVGQAQGQYLVDHAGGSGNPLYLYAGAASDNNAFLFFEGSWSVLQPKIADGTFVIENSSAAVALKNHATLTHEEQEGIFAEITTGWDPETAGDLAAANLAAVGAGGKGDVFILAPNDGTARSIADSFAADSDVTSYVITGQDAEKGSVQYIIDGKQSMTVFKDIRTLVDDAVAAAETFLALGTPTSTTTFNNGTIEVPADPTEAVTVDQSNITAALIDTGYYNACDFNGLPGCANFGVRAGNDEHVEGWEWPDGSTVTIEVDDPGTPTNPDISRTAVMGPASWNPSEIRFDYDFVGEYDIQVGDVVTVSDGVTEKSTTVTVHSITSIDVDTDIVSGDSDPGSDVYVWVCDDAGCYNSGKLTADVVSGEWSVDFTTIHDIVPGIWVDSGQPDDDGDSTFYGIQLPNPYVQASVVGNWIDAREWPTGTEVTLEIDDLSDGLGDTDYTRTATMGQAPWNPDDPNDIVGVFDMSGFTLAVGDVITVYGDIDGNTITKELTVTGLEVTAFDIGADTVSGVATPGASVEVCLNIPGNCISRTVTADSGDGTWTVDYTADHDLEPGDNGWAAEYESDSDRTWYDWNVPNPRVQASAVHNWVNAREWPTGTEVTLEIDDLSDGLGDTDYTRTATMGQAPWNPDDPTDIVGAFDMSGFMLAAGDVVTVFGDIDGNTITKELTVSVLHITAFDIDADTVSGVATKGADVRVCLNIPGDCISRTVTANSGDGTWTVDYTADHDLQPGDNGWAQEYDLDSDHTQYDWNVPNPYVQASVVHNWINAREWPTGAVITLEIDDLSDGLGDTDYTRTATMGQAPWNPDDPTDIVAAFDMSGFMLAAGDVITVFGNMYGDTITKELTVSDLEVKTFDVDADTISGVATNGAVVNVCINVPGNCISRTVTANSGDGTWTVDYTADHDLIPGDNGWVQERDIDSDQTQYDWNVANPNIEAHPDSDSVVAREWPNGTPLTLTIDDPSNGVGVDKTANATMGPSDWDPNDIAAAFNDLEGFDLKSDQILKVTDGTTERTYIPTDFAITGFDLVADTISGIATPNAEVQVGVNMPGGASLNLTADAVTGNWTANYHGTLDLQPGIQGYAKEYDATRNSTQADWRIPDPRIIVQPDHGWVTGNDWTVGNTVTVTVDNDANIGNGYLYQNNSQFVADDSTFWLIGIESPTFDLVPGQYVTVSDTVTTKSMQIAQVHFDSVDEGADTAAGRGPNNASASVYVRTAVGPQSRNITIGATGNWTANFSPFDLQNLLDANIQVYDNDGDSTAVHIFSTTIHLLTVSKAGAGLGTVTSNLSGITCGTDCSQSYNENATVTLTATAATGSAFTGWSGACSGTGTCVVAMTEARSVTATFTNTYLLTVTKAGNGSGTVTSSPIGITCGTDCSQPYIVNTTVTLTATPATGSVFTGWSGACSGTSTCVVSMTAARSVIATFTLRTYLLTVAKAGTGIGTVTSSPAGISCGTDCTQPYNYNTTVTLTATPAAGSAFTGWSGACTGIGACVVHMTAVRSVIATFTRTYLLTVTKAGNGSGTVTSSPIGIACGTDCAQYYNVNTPVTLTATPVTGSVFTGWSGACTGTGTCVVSMTAARSVTATFTLRTYTLTVAKAGTGIGTVTSSPAGISCGTDCSQIYNYNTTVTLTATPAAGSAFTGWSGACTGTGTCVVHMTAVRSVTATFTRIYLLTASKAGTGSGTVTSSPIGITCGTDCAQYYNVNTPVTLTATPATGSVFTGWSGACSGTGSCVVSMTTAKSVIATFTIRTYTLTVAKAGTGSGTVVSSPIGITCGTDCSQPYNYNTTVTLTAIPATGSIFTGWSGACTGTGTCVVSMTAARSVIATFTLRTYTLTVAKAGIGIGTVTSSPAGISCGTDCSQLYNYNTTVTLTATPASGSAFTGWSGACTGTGTCVVSMTAARSVTATFTRIYLLAVSKAGTGSGTVNSSPIGITCGTDCAQYYNVNTTVTLTAIPATGSVFTGWSGACTGTGSCIVSMTTAKSVIATFTIRTYALTVAKAGTGSGTVTSSPAGISCGTDCSQIYNYNTTVTLTAIPAAGSVFTGWSGACTGTGSCVVSMTSAKSAIATFTIRTYTLTVAKAGTGSGTVTSNPAGISCGTDCSQPYNYNTTVTLTAIRAVGSRFTGWSGACTGTSTCVVAMTAAKSVIATFASP